MSRDEALRDLLALPIPEGARWFSVEGGPVYESRYEDKVAPFFEATLRHEGRIRQYVYGIERKKWEPVSISAIDAYWERGILPWDWHLPSVSAVDLTQEIHKV